MLVTHRVEKNTYWECVDNCVVVPCLWFWTDGHEKGSITEALFIGYYPEVFLRPRVVTGVCPVTAN